MKIKPLGFYVLVEMVAVEKVSDGGIVLPDDLVSKEQSVICTGHVKAIGPTAYVGYPGCEPDGDKAPNQVWGIEVGSKVEYRRFEGKESIVPGYENYRYIPDSHIIGVIDDD